MQTFRHGAAQAAALAVLGAIATGAQAQSSVKIYGVLDAGVEYNNGGAPGEKSMWRVNTGNQYASRLGFLATEDLGGGLSAVANIEMGLFVDDGNIVQYGEPKGTFWGRRSVVGLKSGTWGELVLGRDYTPAFWTIIQTDRFRYGLPGTISSPSGLVVSRANKGVFWTSPDLAGLTARLAIATSDPSIPRGGYYSGSLDYKAGNLFVSIAAQKRKEPDNKPSTGVKEYGGGAEYTFKPYVVSAGFWHADPDTTIAAATNKSEAFWFGAGVDLAGGQLNAQVTRAKLEYVGRAAAGKAILLGVSYTYPLSKRTALYAAAGRVANDENAKLQLNSGSQRVGGTFDADPRSLVVGMRHSF